VQQQIAEFVAVRFDGPDNLFEIGRFLVG
jgi:hypothetical protein